jgi:putative glutamine amidotransferase
VSKRVGVTYGNSDKLKPYLNALRAVGVEPVPVAPGAEPAHVGDLDGLLLTGGTDVNPRLYGQEPHPASDAPDDARDATEQRMLAAALERDLPVLAICRGMQLFNITQKGTLHQHVEGHRQKGVDDAHRITVDPGTLLAEAIGDGAHTVNSRHHQVVAKIGEGLRVSAWSEDHQYPEALEMEGKRFALAVQWHPEDLVEKRDEAKRLFQAFARALS